MSKNSKKKLFLVDASGFIFRAYFAIRGNLSTAKGLPTNAIYGFTTMLLNLIEKHKPEYVACVFDTAEPTFRDDMYEDYKANRGGPPEDLEPQFEYIERVVDDLKLFRIAEPGFEADDIIGCLAEKFKECEVVVVSGDKDLMQLVDKRVTMLDTMKNKQYDIKGVKEKLGVEPHQVTDYLGLIGDTSDNIPGVPGVGPKTAAKLLSEHKDIEAVLKAAESMKPSKQRDRLIENADMARLSKELATVKRDIPGRVLKIKLEDLHAHYEYGPKFAEFLKEVEFFSLYKKYFGDGPIAQKSGKKEEVSEVKIKTKAEWKKCVSTLEKSKRFGFEFRLADWSVSKTELDRIVLASGNTVYKVVIGRNNEFEPKWILEEFGKLATKVQAITHDLKQALRIALGYGVELKGKFFDTMLAHYLIDPDSKHTLDVLSQRYLGGDFEDVDRVFTMFKLLYPIDKDLRKQKMDKVYFDIELPVVPVLAEIEHNGIAVDGGVLKDLSKEFTDELEEIEKSIYKIVGEPFNLNSPKQLAEVLFEKLKLPPVKKTKTGYSTNVAVLEKLSKKHPVPKKMLRYRELAKLKNTYVDVLPTLIGSDGRVHAHFNQMVAATGRLSSSDPNLQNIPIKTEDGNRIRKAFVAGKSKVLVGADYSQIELRIIAHLSKDENLIKAFENKEDVHRATAAEIFDVKPKDVTKEQRSAAKAINFGLMYGKTAFGLSQELDISRSEAQEYIDKYFERYKGVKTYLDKVLKTAHKEKATHTLFGRRRPIKDIDSKNFAVRNNAERMAMNSPIQGTAADIMKLAMIKAHGTCKKLGAQMILQVHDELVLEVPKEKAASVEEALKKDMEEVVKLKVPLEVDSGAATNWMDL